MFKKNNRLSKSRDIETVFRAGRSFFSPYFVARFVPSRNHNAERRIAVVVSTKVSKKAVERNRIKRVIRESSKNWLNSLRPGDYALIAKGSAARQPAAALRTGLAQLFERITANKPRK
jgi:ribonuclease P protein component